MRHNNPFDSAEAVAHSNYCIVRGGKVITTGSCPGKTSSLNRTTYEHLHTFIVQNGHPCLGAQAAFNQESVRFGTYDRLSDPAVTPGLARDLVTYAQELSASTADFMTFIAVFRGPDDLTEHLFECMMWDQLAQLHVLDRQHFAWDASVSSDPNTATFSFSFAGTAFFVVGMHPNSSRLARRFTQPALVFNAHRQFERLRRSQSYEKMQRVIRERDQALQGSINPMLQDFGNASEARQYSGRAVDKDWTCPFRDAVSRVPSYYSPPVMRESTSTLRTRIAPSTGVAFRLKKGDRLKVIDPEGEQVSDLMCYADEDRAEWLSSGRTFDYESTLLPTTDNTLWSNRSRPMLRITEDTCGRHDFLLTPCSPEMYRILYGVDEHPSCFVNLRNELAPYGIGPDNIPTTFNIFMNVQFEANGRISVEPPQSKPGDYIVFEALMDLVVGLTACAAEGTNNGRLKPIDYEID